MTWHDFDEKKKELLENPLFGAYVRFASYAHHPNEGISKASKAERKLSEGIIKKTEMLMVEIQKLNKEFNSEVHKAASSLPDIIDAVGYYLRSREEPEGNKSPQKRGPRKYPQVVRNWIFNAIEDAKGDRKKLLALVEFFTPGGEFDSWILDKSQGVWRGPSQGGEQDCAIPAEGFKWLNEFKSNQKE